MFGHINTGFTEKAILFISSLVISISIPDHSINIPAVLVSVIVSCLCSYFDNDGIKVMLTVGFSVLCCFMPELVIFFPLAVYDMIYSKYRYYNLFGIIPLILFYRYSSVQVFLTVIILTALSILIRYRLNIQEELRKRLNEISDEAREMSIKLKKQNADLIEKQDNELYLATLNERNRIARDIHDNVGHLLSSAILQSGALLTVSTDEKTRKSIVELNETLKQAMNSIRTSIHKVYDESIDLDVQIRELIKKFTFCDVHYDYNIYTNPDNKLKYTFISIVKEALSNVMKHSTATRVTIALNEHPAFYQLIIKDNGVTGLEAAEEIIACDKNAKILFLTTFSDDEYIVRAFQIGAKGYILKQNYESIIPSVKAVHMGQRVFGDEIISKMHALTGGKPESILESLGLSEREISIIKHVADGLTNREISRILYLSEGTVRNYISMILDKLNLRDRTQLAIFYYKNILS